MHRAETSSPSMRAGVFDAFWRAVAYCIHPRVVLLSLAPLVFLLLMSVAFALWGWAPCVRWANAWLTSSGASANVLAWMSSMGLSKLAALAAPLLVLSVAVPALLVLSLLTVSVFMSPAVVALVAERRFVLLERRRGAAFWQQVVWAGLCSVLAVALLVLSLPLWLIPLVALVLPPVIWGWLTYRVFAFDALAEHADAVERKQLMREQRWPLWAMGVFCGYLGAVPGAIAVSSALALALAPVLLPLALWLYTLVFAFSSAWFAHYLLAALQARRTPVAAGATPPNPPHPPLQPALV